MNVHIAFCYAIPEKFCPAIQLRAPKVGVARLIESFEGKDIVLTT